MKSTPAIVFGATLASQVMDRISVEKPTVKCPKRPSSTAQTLPPEILGHIFLQCTSNNRDSRFRPSIRCYPPMLLGRICSMWRAVSISLPELWSKFTVGDEDISHVDIEKDLMAAKHWISNSESRPLSILIYYPMKTCSYINLGALRLTQLVEYLISHSLRWNEVELTLPAPVYELALIPFKCGSLSQLVEFDNTNKFWNGSATLTLSSAPKLQVLLLTGDGMPC
ncbi:hypothetical protein BD410DRAFT_843119 [Rickenella mellea]|uniref:F-box domain-containing protein n=1 Tax=Rickenella mellea TaxID=50990 RepID=A0A4Y7PRS7_9AGAM|nr:hypothetical protein BD410DRAFT_843119 [Rickenella mellea]